MAPRLFRGWLEEGEDLQLILILSRCLFRFFEAGWLRWLSEVVQRSELPAFRIILTEVPR